ISLASFTACTLYSWSYLRATLNTSLFSWFYYEIFENKLSTFFIPHQKSFGQHRRNANVFSDGACPFFRPPL
ncbi:hypothetical protein, partial [Anaerotignum sp.]|uniref:hypothetical protein n=1 Tax=Anaerotignum sp. TaxID=2039241 RepID=UPI003A8C0710